MSSKMGLFFVEPVSQLLSEALIGSITKSKETSDSGTIDELELEANRQEMANRISESQARAAQELAIARRIEFADEVEIEEFYDISGDGNAGLSSSETGIKLGVGGSGRKITKRIYRFKGWNEEQGLTKTDT